MTIITRQQRLVARAFWMVKHRWLAILGVAVMTWLSAKLLDITINEKALYLLCICLIIENLITLWLIEFVKKRYKLKLFLPIKLIIHFQIFCDLLILTGILYFTGGIENPFFFIYIFHMVISSILLPRIDAFIQTTIALLLFGLLILADYKGVIPHHCLCISGVPNHELYKDGYYVIRTYSVFAYTSYILVYLATSIGHRLRSQEDKLTTAIVKLRRNDEIKNEYVLRITHDIKGHLAAIQTNLLVLTSGVFGQLEGKQKEFLERAYRRTERLTKFARNLLYLTQLRLDSKAEKQSFSMISLIEKVIADNREDAVKKNIEISSKIDSTISTFSGNKTSIEEVFQNLLSNAIKYSDENGKVEIIVNNRHHKMRIEVIDTGIGIPENELKNIFKEFYRASNAKETGIKGSGVGLSLVKEIINQNDGRIWAENRENGGSKFVIEIPIG